jgi:hypothetical protein
MLEQARSRVELRLETRQKVLNVPQALRLRLPLAVEFGV